MIYSVNNSPVTLNILINYSGLAFTAFSFFLAFIKRIVIIYVFFDTIAFPFSFTFTFINNISLAFAAFAI